ncbi:MAG TPA: hypothetical protein VF173_32955 [Thermoanaerobaculia bacterium]|nr:hypothetical protein [Thermoanaerobaculia bacterium]
MFLRRIPWAAILAAVVLLGALDLHPAGEWHDPLESGAQGLFSKCAQHPDAPRHIEQFEAGQRPDCPYCLHHLRTGGAHLPIAAVLGPPSLAGFRGLISSPLLRENGALPLSARGPPSIA